MQHSVQLRLQRRREPDRAQARASRVSAADVAFKINPPTNSVDLAKTFTCKSKHTAWFYHGAEQAITTLCELLQLQNRTLNLYPQTAITFTSTDLYQFLTSVEQIQSVVIKLNWVLVIHPRWGCELTGGLCCAVGITPRDEGC